MLWGSFSKASHPGLRSCTSTGYCSKSYYASTSRATSACTVWLHVTSMASANRGNFTRRLRVITVLDFKLRPPPCRHANTLKVDYGCQLIADHNDVVLNLIEPSLVSPPQQVAPQLACTASRRAFTAVVMGSRSFAGSRQQNTLKSAQLRCARSLLDSSHARSG